jgi:hypothetical protein
MEELRVLRELAKKRGHISAAFATEVKRGELRRFYVKQRCWTSSSALRRRTFCPS